MTLDEYHDYFMQHLTELILSSKSVSLWAQLTKTMTEHCIHSFINGTPPDIAASKFAQYTESIYEYKEVEGQKGWYRTVDAENMTNGIG